MTLEEKDNVIQGYCGDLHENDGLDCKDCKVSEVCSKVDGDFIANPDELNEAYEILTKHDVINHPNHYCREGGMESIDEMVLIFGTEVVKNFCLCNIWKYRYRAADKNGEEDLRKSDWYVQKYKELCE